MSGKPYVISQQHIPNCEFCKEKLGEWGMKLELSDGTTHFICHDCLYKVIRKVLTGE